MTKRSLLYSLLLTLAAPAVGQLPRILSANLPACTDQAPRALFLIDASSATDCDSTGGGTFEAFCCCLDGAWAACSSGGSGAPTTADYLVKTADGGLSAERVVTDTSTVTWDWATAGQAKATCVDLTCTNCIGGTEIDESSLGDVPTATALAANPSACSAGQVVTDIDANGTLHCSTVADVGGAPYGQYDPVRPPSSCNTCDEFTGGETLSYSWGNQESSTATAQLDSLTLYHPADATGIAIYWFTGPDGSATDWVACARVGGSFTASFNQAALVILAAGDQTTPTDMRMALFFYNSPNRIGARSMTSYTSTQTSIGADSTFGSNDIYMQLRYVSSTKVLTYAFSGNGIAWQTIGTSTLGAHPTTSFGLGIAANNASVSSTATFFWVRVRTDATGTASPYPCGE